MDANQFWKLFKRRRKATTEAGSDLNFDGEPVRDAASIVNGWCTYFRNLYTPSDIYTNDQALATEANNLKNLPVVHSQHDRVTVQEIDNALKSCKTGKACGDDSIYYEHIIHGGSVLRSIICDLYTYMLNLSYVPTLMKRGIIITLHKGGKKRKDDPDSYRAITLTSSLLKLLERVLYDRFNSEATSRISAQQGGFQKGLGVNMTSSLLRETVFYAMEQSIKLYTCFLDVRTAFERWLQMDCLLSSIDLAFLHCY